ncbi:putative S-locus lectin protein kinase family protein [Senna tora]|uniref:Putative S-locus lectin protein kinase family protein n=1 Tax=Senna tora TaxID=362788 RepID=A0A834X6T3_9FABA|nr:putative S-locus lectin protein kinase family protein [Senna tora]
MFLAEENFNDVPILEVVSALKWNSFIEAPKQRGVSSIVREFYANYPERKDGKLFVRNKLVPFDREVIKQIYKLLNVPQETCAFRALKEEENPDYKEIAKELGCADAKPWIISSTSHEPKSIKLSKLHVSSVCWLHFIGHHIIPAGHFTNVTKERAFLTYCIKTKQPVDVIQLMMNQVDQAAKKNIPTLYFPCLITALCAKARVPWLDSELLMDLRGPICSATICEAQRKRFGANKINSRAVKAE